MTEYKTKKHTGDEVKKPVRTISGKPSYNGSPGNLWASESSYSITVKDKNKVTTEIFPAIEN